MLAGDRYDARIMAEQRATPASAAAGLTPGQLYEHIVSQPGMVHDPTQAMVVEHLEALFNRLTGDSPPPWPVRPPNRGGVVARLRRRLYGPQSCDGARGIYLWGGVGRGKTWLMDLFYNQLPFPEKRRMHFHQLMREVHEGMHALKGRSGPLDIIAGGIAERTRVLCLDEFIVSDIGDAMILYNLLKALFCRGVILVASSNTVPDELYRHGLQRASFIPAIELIRERMDILKLDGPTDYRLRILEQAETYHAPHDATTERRLVSEFERLAPDGGRIGGTIRVMGREIPVRRVADDVVWLDFMALCGPPRSQADYLEISRCYGTVFISEIPLLEAELDAPARRFLYLLDLLYDRGVKLVISAAAHPPELYRGRSLANEFERAISRLHEMQTKGYLMRGRTA